jgi:hypothetical protein
VWSFVDDELDDAEADAVLGAICSSADESEPFPEALAETKVVRNSLDVESPSPLAAALLGEVCKPTASSPVVEEPLPCAFLILLWSVELFEFPRPLALAVLGAVCSLTELSEPTPVASAVLGAVCNSVDEEFPSAESLAVLGDICVDVDDSVPFPDASAVLGDT